jgi:hypothetical protein
MVRERKVFQLKVDNSACRIIRDTKSECRSFGAHNPGEFIKSGMLAVDNYCMMHLFAQKTSIGSGSGVAPLRDVMSFHAISSLF